MLRRLCDVVEPLECFDEQTFLTCDYVEIRQGRAQRWRVYVDRKGVAYLFAGEKRLKESEIP